jgi:hypothetical protein
MTARLITRLMMGAAAAFDKKVLTGPTGTLYFWHAVHIAWHATARNYRPAYIGSPD